MVRPAGKIIHRGHVDSALIEIIDDGDRRSLYFSGDVLQSAIYRSTPHDLVLSYTQHMMSALLLNRFPEHVLLIGLGAGSMVNFLHHHLPLCHIDAIDSSQYIIDLARGYFQLPDSAEIAITCCDGYDYVAGRHEDKPPYDLILIDAFDQNGMSASIYCADFFRLCLENMRPNGILSCNLWSGDGRKMIAVKKDLAACFSSVIELPVPDRGNVICLAAMVPNLIYMLELSHQELTKLNAHYGINFRTIIKACFKHNLGFRQKLSRFFS